MRLLVILTIASTLAGCQAEKANKPTPPHQVTGWGPYKFGMTYSDALAALPGVDWNPVALQECDKKLALEGCFLSTYAERRQLPPVDGLAFNPQLTFDDHGKLRTVGLKYDVEDLSPDDCTGLFARVLDRIDREEGPLAATVQSGEMVARKSPGGSSYATSRPSGDQNFVTNFVRSNLRGVKLPTSLPPGQWHNGAFAMVFGAYIQKRCMLSIQYQDGSTEDWPRSKAVQPQHDPAPVAQKRETAEARHWRLAKFDLPAGSEPEPIYDKQGDEVPICDRTDISRYPKYCRGE